MNTHQLRYAMGTAALALGVMLTSAHAQFTDIGAGLTGVDSGSVAWGDYNNDGHLDILVTGWGPSGPVSRVYENNGDGTFTDIEAGLTGVVQGSVAWGDYNNNGRLDILLTGRNASFQPVTKVYHNNGDGTFSELITGITGVWQGSAAWGDYNNNGRLDILLTGFNSSFQPVARVYQNNGNGTFTPIGAGLTGVSGGSAAWGDYNNNGRLDILLTGWGGSGLVTKVYQNNGDGTFADTAADLPGMDFGSAAWGDFDGDGHLDILLTGYDDSFNPAAVIYRNNGDGTFTATDAGLAGVGDGSAATADYDGDGHLDILLTGWSGSGAIAKVYRNNGDGTFTDSGAGLPGVEFSSVAWGDFNNNGNPDILLTGWSDFGAITRVYRNDHAPADDDPDPVDEDPDDPDDPDELTVVERVEDLLDSLHALQAERLINNGIANAATNQLGNVMRSYDKGKLDAACSQLQGFISLIQGQINARKLSAEDGQALIDAANGVKAAIGCP